MQKTYHNTKGFVLIELLIILVVLIALGGVSAFAYHRSHETKKASSSSTTIQKSTQTSKDKTTATVPYAGWKQYCDTTYHYCFKYPADWIADTSNDSNGSGALLANPSKSVQVSYQNPDTRDGGPEAFTPSYIQKLSAANQDLSVVCGYYQTTGVTGSYSPMCNVVDSSILTTFPQVIGQQGKFVDNAVFTDTIPVRWTKDLGQMVATPTANVDTAAGAQAWLNSTDAKTSLLILQSFIYQQ